MATDPKPSVSPNAASAPAPLPAEMEQALACGLGKHVRPQITGILVDEGLGKNWRVIDTEML
jgi:hypothetical protein